MRRFTVLPALALLLAGCKSSGSPASPPPASSASAMPTSSQAPATEPTTARSGPPMSPAKLQEVTRGDAQFATAMYRFEKPSAGNRLISPLSIRVAFAMAYSGARGETKAELQKALGLGSDDAAVHAGFRGLLEELNRRSAPPNEKSEGWERDQAQRQVAVLRVVNRLWGQSGRRFEPSFKALVRDDYGAPLEELDFKNDLEGSRGKINAWVSEKTEKKIPSLIPPRVLTPATTLVLTNALYFKAQWNAPFSERATKEEDFFVEGTRAAKVPMMHGSGHVGYSESKDATVLELPYADENLAMVFVLPKAKAGLPALEGALRAEDIARWTKGLTHVQATYAIPRFKFEAGLPSLVDAMKAMGVTRAFKYPDADFSGVDGTHDLYISAAIHKTFIDVNEKGTEAAAATALMMGDGAGAPVEPPKTFVADHPFLFFIHDKKTGALLFLGHVGDPSRTP